VSLYLTNAECSGITWSQALKVLRLPKSVTKGKHSSFLVKSIIEEEKKCL